MRAFEDGTADLQIIGAAYGKGNVTGTVIGLVDRSTTPQSLSVVASDAVFGDTWPGVDKSLTVVYRYGDDGTPGVAAVKKGETLVIDSSPGIPRQAGPRDVTPQLTVFGATYGPADVTDAVRQKIVPDNQSLTVVADNATFGDSWYGVPKTFVVVAAYTGQIPYVDIVVEHETYTLTYRPPFQVLSARWGVEDVTNTVQDAVRRRALTVDATRAVLGDGGLSGPLSLTVVSQYGTEVPRTSIAVEDETLSIDYVVAAHYDPPPDPTALNVVGATYGRADVTEQVRDLVSADTLDLTADNQTFGDSWHGVQKSFTLTYGWGPAQPTSLAVAENATVDVRLPQPRLSMGLISLAGAFADGDVAMAQASNGRYWAVVPQTGRIMANADEATATPFTVRLVPGGAGRITLATADGSIVTVGPDGLLYALPGATPAVLAPSVAATGSVFLGVEDTPEPFAKLDVSGAVIAGGTYLPTFDASFRLRMLATDEGLANHVRALGLDADVDVDWALLKLVWDLTGGWFSALGLGPLINGNVAQPGLYALISQSQIVRTALNAVLNAVKANAGSAVVLGAMLAFVGTLWDAGLMWQAFRLLLNSGAWWAVSWATTEILKWTLLPEAGAAELVVGFSFWAYTTTTDALAYINSVNGTQAVAAGKAALATSPHGH